ncbi:DUF2785 domain-containing protein, partial [Bacillus paranthracis]|uniref:DUF2785 domain-containing protein n=1 Tax=Bacillus paranthracis TaxID=2026186 RepID=UPI0024059C3E
ITYTNLETDFRGYIENKGWAHCLAHVSDAFTEIVHNTYTTFEGGARLELMKRVGIEDALQTETIGYAHIAFSVGSKEKVNE